MGTAGDLEAVILARTIQDGVVPPATNYKTPDPDCDLDYEPDVEREMEVDAGMLLFSLRSLLSRHQLHRTHRTICFVD